MKLIFLQTEGQLEQLHMYAPKVCKEGLSTRLNVCCVLICLQMDGGRVVRMQCHVWGRCQDTQYPV